MTHEALNLMKILQTKPQIKDWIKNSYDLYYAIILLPSGGRENLRFMKLISNNSYLVKVGDQ